MRSAPFQGMFELFINFSGIYLDEEIADPDSLLDLSQLEGTECYCSDVAASAIRSFLEPFSYAGLHWIDGGDYHYVSLFWLEKIDRDFILVLFDNHSDDMEPAFGSDILSCGSWVRNARDLPFCRRTYHIRSMDDIPQLPEGTPVYLSIDKDVLSPEYASTNWDQGVMTLDEMMSATACLTAGRDLLGADICGGKSIVKGASPADILLNRNTDIKLEEYLKTLLIIETK